jgi:hypothetical protein
MVVGVVLNLDAIMGIERKAKVMHETTNEKLRVQTFQPVDTPPVDSVITRWFGPNDREDYCSHSCSHSCGGHK